MNRKIIILILLLSLITIFTSCTYGSSIITIGSVDMGKTEISGSYSKFSGFKQKNYEFQEGDSINFDTVIETKSGELKILLIDDDDNVLQEINESGESSFEVMETSDYKIKVEGIDHKGSFSVKIELK